MTLPAGRYRMIYNLRLEDGDELDSAGPFEIVYSRRCPGKQHRKRHEDDPTDYYGIAMDIAILKGAVLRIIRDEEEIRRYE